jgi:multiple sugar transport system permease protein
MRLISRKTLLLFFFPGALFIGLFLVYPIVKMAFDSFFSFDTIGNRTFAGFANYERVFTGDGFLLPLRNTLTYVVIAVTAQTIFGLLFALVLENDFRGSRVIRSLMLTPLMIAPLVAGLIWRLMFSAQFGIINQLLVDIGLLQRTSGILWLADARFSLLATAIADIWLTTPFMMLMIFAGLQGVDSSMIEAARIDGANPLQQVFRIKIPNIKPILLTALSIRIVDAARTFDIIWVMTQGGPNRSSEVLSTVIYRNLARYNNPGFASAMAVIFMIALVVFTLVFMQSLWNPKKRAGGGH